MLAASSDGGAAYCGSFKECFSSSAMIRKRLHGDDDGGQSRPGPKLKIGARGQERILGVLEGGGSLRDAADALGICRRTLFNARKNDPEFCRRVLRAAAAGKIRLLRRISSATDWRAAAWLLERKYGREYGRRELLEYKLPAGKLPEPDERFL
jgi:hypothetical protein